MDVQSGRNLPRDSSTSTAGRKHQLPLQHEKKAPTRGAFLHAPEKTRTSTDHTVHKALNYVHVVWMLLAASRSGKSLGLLDALDATEGVDVVTSVVTLDEYAPAGPSRKPVAPLP
jgi:hypothetical protein